MAEAQGQEVTQPALTALNQAEAVAAIAAAIVQEEKAEETPRDDKGKFAPKTASQPAESTEVEAKPEGEAEAKTEEAPQTEEEQPEIQPEPRKFKLKYKGEEEEVDEPQIIELAQKGKDYTQKTQALAKEREELAAKVKSDTEAAVKQYEQQLEIYKLAVIKMADPDVVNADLNKMANEDPARALQTMLKRQQLQQTLQGIAGEQQRLLQTREAEAQATKLKQAQEAVEKLNERIPGWNNDLYTKILKVAQTDYGFAVNEANAISDHRVIEVLNDARQWREHLAAKPKTVEKRVANVPKVQKPGTTEKADPKAQKLTEGMARLSKTGSRQDAQALVLELMNAGRL